MATTPSGRPVFVSYSRENAAFARALYAELRQLGFSLWRDRTEMAVGDDWWRQVQEAIRGCDAVVLCLSPEAVRSPVVADEWMYARQVGTRVLPVLAAEVDFAAVPRWMRKIDWADLRADAAERDHTWDRFIHRLTTARPVRRVPFMAEPLPDGFVLRTPELESVVRRLVDERHDPIATMVALVGAGGFGKTTLARAACHDQRVRAAFDDGVVWVRLGEKPRDVVGHVLDVVEAVSGERPAFSSLPAAVSRLSEVLADRDVLLVVDDVWNRAHLEPFLAGGAHCARLITTREVDALPERVQVQGLDVMKTAEATALLTWQLPAIDQADATPLADHLGGWPLLLKLTNGALRGYIREGKSPSDALAFAHRALSRRGFRAFDPANPVAREQAVAATLAASLELLNDEEQRRFERLAVVPDGVAAPIDMLGRLWLTDDFETEELCRKLANHSLVLGFDAAGIRVHDVVRKFLRGEHRNEVATWHAQLLDRYRSDLRVAHWSELPGDQTYLLSHLVHHLLGADRRDELRELFNDQRWMRRRVASDDFRYDGFVSDTTLAWEHDAHIELLRQAAHDEEPAAFGRCVRYALIASSIRSVASNYSPGLVARAVATDLWSPVLALSVASSVTVANRRAAMYTALLGTGRVGDVLRRESIIASAREAIRSMQDDVSRARALAELAGQLDGVWRDEAVQEGVALALGSSDKRDRARALFPLAPLLGGTSIDRALAGLYEVEWQLDEEPTEDGVVHRERAEPWAAAMAAIAARRKGVKRDAILMHALQIAMNEEREGTVARGLAAIAPQLTAKPARALAEWLRANIPVVLPVTDATVVTCQQAASALLGDVPGAAAAVVANADSRIRLWGDGERPKIGHNSERFWAHVLAALADRLRGDDQRWAVGWGLTAALTVAHAKGRSLALAPFLPHLPKRSRQRVAPYALELAQLSFAADDRVEALMAFAPYIEESAKEQAVDCALAIARETQAPSLPFPEEHVTSRVLQRLAPHLPARLVSSALAVALTIRDEQGFGYRVDAMDALAPHLDVDSLRAALEASTAIEDHVWQAGALGSLAASAPERTRTPMVLEALAAAALAASPFDRAGAIVSLAPLLDDGTRGRAIDLSVAFGLPEVRAFALTAVAAGRDVPPEVRARALEEALAIESDQSRAEALNALARILGDDEVLLRRCLEAALAFEDHRDAGVVLTAVVPNLRGPDFDRGVQALRALNERAYWGIALSAIASQAGGQPLARGLDELKNGRPQRPLVAAALDETDTHLNDEFRAFATGVLAPHLPADLVGQAVHVALGIRAHRRRDQVLASIVRRTATGAIAALVNDERDDERRSTLLLALGPHAGGTVRDEALRAALDLPDARERVEALAPFGGLASDSDTVRRELRLAAAVYLLHCKDGVRAETLWLADQAQICAAPMFSADTLAEAARHVVDICRRWSWSPTAVRVERSNEIVPGRNAQSIG